MVLVTNGLMPAVLAVSVAMLIVRGVRQLVLVVVAFVGDVGVPLVDVVHVALVLGACVSAVRPVGVRVLSVNIVLGGRHCSSLL
jgi:hypothetical protein